MFVRIQSADRLAKALGSANSAITAKGTDNPIPNSMLLEAQGEELTITVVDTSSHQLKLVVPAEVNLPGSVMLPGDYFTKIIARLGNQPVVLKTEGSQLHAQSGASDTHKFDLTQGDPEDFPLETDLPPIMGTVDGDGLHEALKAVLKAATEAEQEVIFHSETGTLAIYTSHWISCRSRFQMIDIAQAFTFAVKKTAIAGGRLPQWSGPVNIHHEDGKAAFSQGNEHLLIKMPPTEIDIEGLDAIISVSPIGHLVVHTATIRNRIHTIAIGKQRCVIKTTGKAQKKLQIVAETSGSGGSRMEVPINGEIRGSVPEVHLSVELLEKALATVDGDDMRLEFIDYDGTGQSIAVRISNDGNPEKRQTFVLPLQDTQQ
jgi:DNA polymerase III sliding clamp (beta) subunit (PCNA family)